MKGYKAFNKDWTCRNKQYRLGETFSEDVDLSECTSVNGYHRFSTSIRLTRIRPL